MSKLTILNAPTELLVEEIVAGCEFRLGLFVEEVLDGDTANPYDFSAVTFAADVRRDHDSPEIAASFVISARAGEPGWIDLLLDGDKTGLLEEWDYVSSVKVWPTGEPAEATTLVLLRLPVHLRATR